MPYGITQYYLPPGRGDISAVTPAEAGTRLSDPEGMQGWVLYNLIDTVVQQMTRFNWYSASLGRSASAELLVVCELVVTNMAAETDGYDQQRSRPVNGSLDSLLMSDWLVEDCSLSVKQPGAAYDHENSACRFNDCHQSPTCAGWSTIADVQKTHNTTVLSCCVVGF